MLGPSRLTCSKVSVFTPFFNPLTGTVNRTVRKAPDAPIICFTTKDANLRIAVNGAILGEALERDRRASIHAHCRFGFAAIFVERRS